MHFRLLLADEDVINQIPLIVSNKVAFIRKYYNDAGRRRSRPVAAAVYGDVYLEIATCLGHGATQSHAIAPNQSQNRDSTSPSDVASYSVALCKAM